MNSLKAKIPVPFVAIVIAAVMSLGARPATQVSMVDDLRNAVLVVSAVVGTAAIASFLRVRTTLKPRQPERASTLVTGGMYRLSRNPMYLSLALLLIAYAIHLRTLPAMVGPLAYLFYVTRFQIIPEEQALELKFGAAFRDYKRRVRRWV